MKKIGIQLTVLIASTLAVSADSAEEKKKRFQQEFRHVPVPELPAKAAEAVKKTPTKERSEAAVVAVETIKERHPSAAGPTASAISRAAPETRAAIEGAATRRKEGQGNGGGNSGPGNGNGNANGGVGHGVNKP